MPFNGFSEEYLDRLETNGNIQADNKAYAKRKLKQTFSSLRHADKQMMIIFFAQIFRPF
jgi:hypothetical protein